MSPSRIQELLQEAQLGQADALKIVDRAFEQMIFEGSEKDLEQTVQIIGNFLAEAFSEDSVPQAA